MTKVTEDFLDVDTPIPGQNYACVSFISPENIIKNVVNNTESGSIIVLHDNNKFGEKMLTTLPEIIKKLSYF